jgi:hypothetical protein
VRRSVRGDLQGRVSVVRSNEYLSLLNVCGERLHEFLVVHYVAEVEVMSADNPCQFYPVLSVSLALEKEMVHCLILWSILWLAL